MAKATMTLPNGLHVVVEGSPKEIAAFLNRNGSEPKKDASSEDRALSGKGPKKESSDSKRDGPTSHILQLRADKFFKTRRSLSDIRLALEQVGHIYPITSLSPILVRLVRKRELRRLKGEKGWVYVN